MVQIIIYTLLISFIAISIHYYLVNRQLKSEIAQIEDELKIIVNENIRHRLLAPPYSYTKNICFQINKLCTNYQNDILSLKTSEKKYKDLMINLSHDVRTPLASMLGHLELLTESINESPSDNLSISLEVINRKALELTDFVEMLFQWTKLDANEEKFVFSSYDINEQSRMLISKWISFFDKNNIEYSFHIPEKEYRCSIDAAAYQRILDNLFKNILNH
ncbi:MAG: histidine kinase dimerization/phospho-acceptor domain-containing protein, partial [Blautia obeum]|nr:histidine kinase dimerization/phospho-acceptor domain-containing protein [Blautia obeum]